ncbi:hypothetical protein HELRODRAFT_168423 [Helobdella robusta]|uniref:Uncharacterized protein n=1 Tax=Helobdella robusta TaxID=6412 RepID=T1F0K7_HELRO|nr:hypothetical protein HELRODRAFT_168423 [Helobdella robusta]ESO09440.1 hypothetical protein HELRODRAFT_168423 [Helobdella robusta]
MLLPLLLLLLLLLLLILLLLILPQHQHDSIFRYIFHFDRNKTNAVLSSSRNAALIGGIVVGVFILIFILAFVIFLVCKYKKNDYQDSRVEPIIEKEEKPVQNIPKIQVNDQYINKKPQGDQITNNYNNFNIVNNISNDASLNKKKIDRHHSFEDSTKVSSTQKADKLASSSRSTRREATSTEGNARNNHNDIRSKKTIQEKNLKKSISNVDEKFNCVPPLKLNGKQQTEQAGKYDSRSMLAGSSKNKTDVGKKFQSTKSNDKKTKTNEDENDKFKSRKSDKLTFNDSVMIKHFDLESSCNDDIDYLDDINDPIPKNRKRNSTKLITDAPKSKHADHYRDATVNKIIGKGKESENVLEDEDGYYYGTANDHMANEIRIGAHHRSPNDGSQARKHLQNNDRERINKNQKRIVSGNKTNESINDDDDDDNDDDIYDVTHNKKKQFQKPSNKSDRSRFYKADPAGNDNDSDYIDGYYEDRYQL